MEPPAPEIWRKGEDAAGKEKFVRHEKAHQPREESQIHHTEIWPVLRDRLAARHSKREAPADQRC